MNLVITILIYFLIFSVVFWAVDLFAAGFIEAQNRVKVRGLLALVLVIILLIAVFNPGYFWHWK